MSELRFEHVTATGQRVEVRKGDLTAEPADAIVNAANGHLAHGGGVAAAIARAGGPAVSEESRAWVRAHGTIPDGGVAVTSGGRLRAKHVIHAVGPVWEGGGAGEDATLASAVRNAIEKAEEMGLASIALPAISSGIFGFPKDRCASIFAAEVLAFCERKPGSRVREVRLVNIDEETTAIFERAFRERCGAR
jgi:putative ATPase